MRFVTWATIFLLTVSLSAADRNCDPACTNPEVCDERPLGTCCCPFPYHAYPFVGTGEYHTLDAYKIQLPTEAFNTTDNTLSEFWSLWDEQTIDCVELNPAYEGNTREQSTRGFTGEQDAFINVKAAWNDSGLFLCFTVSDDSWDSTEDADSLWWRDVVQVYLTSFGTRIMEIVPQVFPDYYTSRLTSQTAVLRSRIGHPDCPADLRFADDNARLPDTGTAPDENPEYAARFETVVLSNSVRVQEWFIPFRTIGIKPEPDTHRSQTGNYARQVVRKNTDIQLNDSPANLVSDCPKIPENGHRVPIAYREGARFRPERGVHLPDVLSGLDERWDFGQAT